MLQNHIKSATIEMRQIYGPIDFMANLSKTDFRLVEPFINIIRSMKVNIISVKMHQIFFK